MRYIISTKVYLIHESDSSRANQQREGQRVLLSTRHRRRGCVLRYHTSRRAPINKERALSKEI